MTTKYRRVLLLSDSPVTGYYRYSDRFQILPPPDTSKKPPYSVAHHPFIFELKFDYNHDYSKKYTDGSTVPEMFQSMHARDRFLHEYILLLNLFCFSKIITYSGKQCWFINMEDKSNTEMFWGQQFYEDKDVTSRITKFTKITCPPIEEIEHNKYYKLKGKYVGDPFKVPGNLTSSFDHYFILSPDAKKFYLKALTFFRYGSMLKSKAPSLSFASFVSSIETMIQYDYRNIKAESCKTCGQKIYSIHKKFKEFMKRYVTDNSDFEKYCSKIYQRRSGILHTGNLFLGEDIPVDFNDFEDFDDENFFLKINAESIVRTALINWLYLSSSKHT